ncbi:MAG: hypothetical protein CSA66_07185 [Proteobacteria bacterium]|nr:MAG: hypothetical protein CSA66_07185 [Pseudomonadota bacterium]
MAISMLLRGPLVALSVVLSLGACGDSVTFIECPLGTRPEGDRCVPIGGGDTSIAADTAVAADTSMGTPHDSAAAGDTGSAEVTQDTEISVDTSSAPLGHGAACLKNADCAGGTCLDWPGGYCTALGCEADSCGDGSACMAVAGGNRVCLVACTGDADCRPDGQACKVLEDAIEGGLQRVCVGVREAAGATGAACLDPLGCLGAATCLGAFPGGYCAVIGCEGGEGCPADAGCVRLDGQPTCLKRCTDEASCGGTAGAERACSSLRTVEGVQAPFCISGAGDVPLGKACLSDFECAGGSCQILGDGRCSQSDAPCFIASEAEDCGPAEFCFVTGDSRSGVCATPCASGGVACPGATFCLAEGASVDDEAWCRPACTVGGGECDATEGLSCHFGVPISDGGQGRYVCGLVEDRGFGAACESDGDCASGACLLAGGDTGYCTRPCGFDGYCPFPGFCVHGAEDRCHLACLSSQDCPSGFTCDLATGSARDVCVAP